MFVVLLFLLSGFKSCEELKYTMSGVVVAGSVAKVTEHAEYMSVKYRFRDTSGKWWKGGTRINETNWDRPEKDQVEVIYLPNDPEVSTLVSQRSTFFPVLFAVMGLWLIGWVAYIFYLAKEGRLE